MRRIIFLFFLGVFIRVSAQDTLSLPGMKVMAEIRYGSVDVKQSFDLYLPAKVGKGRAPLMIWIHGGGWGMGRKNEMEVAYLAARGWAIASIGYRFSRDSVFPAQVRDCNAAIRMIWRNAAKWRLDTSRFVLAGASAGGHLASLIAMSNNNQIQDFDAWPLSDHPVSFRGVINFYGPADFYAFHGDETGYKVDSPTSSVSLLLGGPALGRPKWAKYASPVSYVDAGDPPVLILHGDRDPIVPLFLDQLFYGVLREAGVRSELVVLAGAGHGGPAFSDSSSQQKVISFLESIYT
ncbi:alpha/beta hydrolase fold domain-containing protein [Puia sp. P3]|uniref:alpha/beta hydrolase fold domain-containing protein n=1 Tax=Puia sp. P3 TaxID=3423952 RepID=UPI003D67EC99